ncbi:hypothetical protein GGI07_001632 [Coemansia sp. Benny D115]|nr:hypothetical protein GGI07_001632 [Coemansia sp. Benny D115]
MSAQINHTNGGGHSNGAPGMSEADRRKLAQEESKNEFCKLDSIMEPTTTQFVDQYLQAGGAPFNIMHMLTSSYEGLAAMANMVNKEVMGAYGSDDCAAITEAVSKKIVDKFDSEKADAEYNRTQRLPEYIEDMIEHMAWRKTIYRLSELNPKSTMIGAALQRIAEKGLQSEMTSLSSASLHTHLFYPLFVECFERIAPADDENIKERMKELIGTVCRSEHTYFVAQYILMKVREKLGPQAESVRRVEQELESYMLENYNQPQLAVHFRLLLDGMSIGGDDPVANAVAAIIQSGHSSPGDVMVLYKQYHGAFVAKKPLPPLNILRNKRVLLPMIEQAFGHLWGAVAQNTRTDLMEKYMWLIACATHCTDEDPNQINLGEIQSLIARMKEVRDGLPIRPIQTILNSHINKILGWIEVPILARVVVLWIRDLLTYDDYTYYNTYFHSSEVPIPLLLLEEVAYRHPLLKPLVFEAYKETFESTVPDFTPEKQIRLQKVAINRMAVLVQLSYSLPILRYFVARAEGIDESVLSYFVYRTLVQFEAPYPKDFYAPMLRVVEYAINAIKIDKESVVSVVRAFLENVDDDLARKLHLKLSAGSESPIQVAD